MHTLQQLSIRMVKSEISGKDLQEGMVVHLNLWPEDKKYGLVVKQVIPDMFTIDCFDNPHQFLAIFIPATNEVCIINIDCMYTHLGNFTWEI